MRKIYLAIYLFLFTMFVSAQEKPNIVIILSDDHAFQAIGAYGGIGNTPNIDRLAAEGALFSRAYVANSICGPSRASLLTGKFSHKNGYKDNANSVFDHNQDTFVKRLQEGGYQTAWIGKQHLGNHPQGLDYYSILPGQGQYYNPDFLNSDGTREHIEGYVTNIITDKAENWLDNRDPDKPFCLVIGHKATHRTWLPDTSDFGRYDGYEFEVPETFYDNYKGRKAAQVQEMSIAKDLILGYDLKMLSREGMEKEGTVSRMTDSQKTKFEAYYGPIYHAFLKAGLEGKELAEWKYERYMNDYLSTAHSMDRNIGRILEYLDNNQLTGNTLVVYMSDQGFYMGEHGWFDKRFMYEESFRTPLIARFPGAIAPQTTVDALVMNIDIAPTLLEVAGVPIPDAIQGKSIVPIITGERVKIRDVMYYHYYENGEHAVSPHFGISDGRYKLIRFYQAVDAWELYDLEADPHELNNLYYEDGYNELVVEMKKRLREKIIKVDDQEALELLSSEI